MQEVLPITPVLQNLITRVKDEGKLLEAARANGFTSLQEDCLEKVLSGLTTVEELYTVASC